MLESRKARRKSGVAKLPGLQWSGWEWIRVNYSMSSFYIHIYVLLCFGRKLNIHVYNFVTFSSHCALNRYDQPQTAFSGVSCNAAVEREIGVKWWWWWWWRICSRNEIRADTLSTLTPSPTMLHLGRTDYSPFTIH